MSGLFAKNQKIGILRQALFAAPNDASDNFITILGEPGSLPDPGVQIDNFNHTSAYGQLDEVDRQYVDSTTLLKSFGWKFQPVYTQLYWYLLGFFPYVSEAGASGYKKSFRFQDFTNGGSTNFGADEGYVFGIAEGNYNDGSSAGDGKIISCAVVDELTFDMDFTAAGISRLLQANVVWKGNQMVADQFFDGTWVPPVTTGYLSGFVLNTLTIDGTSYAGVCVKKINVSLKRNVTAACVTTKANDYDTMPEMVTTIDLIANDTSLAAFGKYAKAFTNGVPVNCAFDISNGTDTTAGVLSFKTTYGVLTDNPLVNNGDKTEIRLVIKTLRPAAGHADVVTLADGVDRLLL